MVIEGAIDMSIAHNQDSGTKTQTMASIEVMNGNQRTQVQGEEVQDQLVSQEEIRSKIQVIAIMLKGEEMTQEIEDMMKTDKTEITEVTGVTVEKEEFMEAPERRK